MEHEAKSEALAKATREEEGTPSRTPVIRSDHRRIEVLTLKMNPESTGKYSHDLGVQETLKETQKAKDHVDGCSSYTFSVGQHPRRQRWRTLGMDTKPLGCRMQENL